MSKQNNRLLVSIRHAVKDKPLIKCCLKFIYRLPKKEFQEYVAKYIPTNEIDAHILSVKDIRIVSYGEQHQNQIIVLTDRDSTLGGFCAEWLYWLNRLHFSDQMGFLHYINWKASQFFLDNEVSEKNIFNYYFIQPYGLEYDEVIQSKNVVIDKNSIDYGYYDIFAPGRNDDYELEEKDLVELSLIQKKYIRLKDDLMEQMNDEITNLLKEGRVLAVHARGADAKIPYKDHPIPVDADEYIKRTKLVIDKVNADKVFLATDDNNILKVFEKEFGDRLLFYRDTERSDGTRMSCYGEREREKHHYKLGREIIRDIYTLSACQALVCSKSYVSYIARIVKKTQETDYEMIECINTEMRKNGVNLSDIKVKKSVEKKWDMELESKRNRME